MWASNGRGRPIRLAGPRSGRTVKCQTCQVLLNCSGSMEPQGGEDLNWAWHSASVMLGPGPLGPLSCISLWFLCSSGGLQVLQMPVNHSFIQLSYVGAEEHLKPAGQWPSRGRTEDHGLHLVNLTNPHIELLWINRLIQHRFPLSDNQSAP